MSNISLPFPRFVLATALAPPLAASPTLQSLELQINNLKNVLNHITDVKYDPHSPLPSFILVGHSIGCYLNRRLTAEGKYHVLKVVECMPFVKWEPDFRAIEIPVMAARALPNVTLAAASGLGRIGSALGEGVIRKVLEFQGVVHGVDEAVRLIRNRDYPRTFLTLGREEIEVLKLPYDVGLLNRVLERGGEVVCIWIKDGSDVWCGTRNVEFVKEGLRKGWIKGGLVRFRELGAEVRHDFVCRKGWEGVARIIAEECRGGGGANFRKFTVRRWACQLILLAMSEANREKG